VSCWRDSTACAGSRAFCEAEPNSCLQGDCGECYEGLCYGSFPSDDASSLHNCCGNGIFVPEQGAAAPGFCQCQGDWIGTDCCTFLGPPDQMPPTGPDGNPPCYNNGGYCFGHGICDVDTNQCQCEHAYTGQFCDTLTLSCTTYCGVGACCESGETCPSYKPVCDPTYSSCSQCLTDADCVNQGLGNQCVDNFRCGCASDADCTAPTADHCAATAYSFNVCACGSRSGAFVPERCPDGTTCVQGTCL